MLVARTLTAAVLLITAVAPAYSKETSPPLTAGELRLEPAKYRASKGPAIVGEVGTLGVRENRNRSDSRIIPLSFIRLSSSADQPRAPIVFLAGGPGQTATGYARSKDTLTAWQPILDVADVILLDQRGTTDPDLRWRWDGPLPVRFFADHAVALEHAREVSRRANLEIRARGIDLDGYTTEQSADDIDELRRALGLEKISLLGFSYGTHLAQSILRRHGEHVEDVALFGIEGPDQTWKLPAHLDTHVRRISLLAGKDEQIASKIPDLFGLIDRVSKKLDDDPMVVEIEDRRTGKNVELPVGGFGLRLILRIDVGDASDIPVLPRLLFSIDQGDSRLLRWFVQKRAGLMFGVGGMTMMMDSASGASADRQALIASQGKRALFGDVVNFPFPDVAPLWNPPNLAPDFREPLTSDVRTLFVSGSLDWNSPPFQAEQLRWGFSNGTQLIIDHAGHEQTLYHPEIPDLLARFFQGDDVSGERPASPPIRFVPLEGYDPERTHPSVPRRR